MNIPLISKDIKVIKSAEDGMSTAFLTIVSRMYFRGLLFALLFLQCLSINAQTKRGFLVGISEYPQIGINSWNNIHGANDIELLSQTLESQSFKLTTLINKASTAAKIRKELKNFISSCKPNDIVYLHFSCHGQPFEDQDGDESDGWDEALVPIDALKVYQKGKYTGENHITDDELNGYLKDIRKIVGPQGFVYVVIDACHAGSSYRGDELEDSIIVRGTDLGFSMSNKPYTPRIDKRGRIKIEESSNMANICILEACRSYQVNSEIHVEGKYYGSLSYYVNMVLQSTSLAKNISWTDRVVHLMNEDIRLVRQNPVIEASH